MNEKITLITKLGLVAAVLVTVYFWMAGSALEVADYAIIGTILVIAGIATFMIWKRSSDIKKGFVAEDELSKKAAHKAGYYAYLSTIWLTVGLLWGKHLHAGTAWNAGAFHWSVCGSNSACARSHIPCACTLSEKKNKRISEHKIT